MTLRIQRVWGENHNPLQGEQGEFLFFSLFLPGTLESIVPKQPGSIIPVFTGDQGRQEKKKRFLEWKSGIGPHDYGVRMEQQRGHRVLLLPNFGKVCIWENWKPRT